MDFMNLFAEAENIKRIKSFYAAVAEGNFDAARQFLDPDLEWIEPEAPGLWFSGSHRGPGAVFRNIIEPTYGKIASFQLKISKFHEVGDTIFVIGRASGRTKMTGKQLDAPFAHVWAVRNGKAIRVQAYEDTVKWLEAIDETPGPIERMAAA